MCRYSEYEGWCRKWLIFNVTIQIFDKVYDLVPEKICNLQNLVADCKLRSIALKNQLEGFQQEF